MEVKNQNMGLETSCTVIAPHTRGGTILIKLELKTLFSSFVHFRPSPLLVILTS